MTGQSNFAVITLEGELDIARRDEIRAALDASAPGPSILVDLSRVTYADSTTIAELLRFRGEADANRRRIALLIGDPHFARVLQYAGLGGVFAIFDNRAAALTSLRET